MDIYSLLTTESLLLSGAVWGLVFAVKRSWSVVLSSLGLRRFEPWRTVVLSFLPLLLGSLLALFGAVEGEAIDRLVHGLLAGAAAMLGHQLVHEPMKAIAAKER